MTIRESLLPPLPYALALRQAQQAEASPTTGVNTGPSGPTTACIMPSYRQTMKLASAGGRCGDNRTASAPRAPTT
eukprot:14764541-Alexandrium_andersonii.AAC.1